MFIKFTYTFLVLMVTTWLTVKAQDIQLTGGNLCSNGQNGTTIGITDSDPSKYYALFHDGKRIAIQQYDSGITPNPITFGHFTEPGVYTIKQFDDFVSQNTSVRGKAISGQIHIYATPVVYLKQDTLETQSGKLFSFQPQSSMNDADFMWTASIKEGKLKKFNSNGKGMIELTLELLEAQATQVVFSITPIAPASKGGCMGSPRELTLWVNP